MFCIQTADRQELWCTRQLYMRRAVASWLGVFGFQGHQAGEFVDLFFEQQNASIVLASPEHEAFDATYFRAGRTPKPVRYWVECCDYVENHVGLKQMVVVALSNNSIMFSYFVMVVCNSDNTLPQCDC